MVSMVVLSLFASVSSFSIPSSSFFSRSLALRPRLGDCGKIIPAAAAASMAAFSASS